MEDDLFQELLSSAREARAIHEDEQESSRVMRYHGKVLVAIEEEGQTVWTLEEAASRLREKFPPHSMALIEPDPKFIREELNQTQEGFSELIGVSVRTLQEWEQGRREPRGPSRRLLSVASRHPVEVLETMQAAQE